MMKIAICDDEENDRSKLNEIIINYCTSKGILFSIDCYDNGKNLLICQAAFDIIFLDINIGDINGIDIAKQIRKIDKKVRIIYVTNYSNYRNFAFSVRAFGYVTKPYSNNTIYKQIDDVLTYNEQQSEKPNATFKTGEGIKTLNLEDICYFEYIDFHIKIVTVNNKFNISKTISSILEEFKDYGFAMPHKSFVVNYFYVSKFEGYNVILTNSTEIPLSQKRAVAYKKGLHEYLKNNFNLIAMAKV